MCLENIYAFDLARSPMIVFDVGSNIGLTALAFRARWPGATVFAFEPDPAAFSALEENCRADQRIITVNRALAGTSGYRRFFTSQETWMSGFTRRHDDQAVIDVRADTLDEIMDELQLDYIDVLKLDVEGAETEILGSSQHMHAVGTVIGELHADLTGFTSAEFLSQFVPGRPIELRPTDTGCTFIAGPLARPLEPRD